MKRVMIAWLIGSLLVLAACTSMEPASQGEPEAAKKVKIAEAALISMGVPVTVEARVVASALTEIMAEVGGSILRSHVEVGDAVTKGQILFELDQTDYMMALQRAELERERLLLELDKTKVQLRDHDATTMEMIANSLRGAELNVEAARRTLQKTKIASPADGVVTEHAGVQVGQLIGAGQRLLQIEGLNVLHVEAAITEKDMLHLQQQERLPIHFPVLNRTDEGEILFIAPSAHSSRQGSFALKLRLDNAEGQLRPGMSAQVVLDDSLARKTIAVPVGAVLQEAGQSYVYTISGDSKAIRRNVELGRKNKDYAEIAAGLTEGQTIVVVGQSLLSDGDAVDVVD